MSFGKELRDLTNKNKLELELKPLINLIKKKCFEEAKKGTTILELIKIVK